LRTTRKDTQQYRTQLTIITKLLYAVYAVHAIICTYYLQSTLHHATDSHMISKVTAAFKTIAQKPLATVTQRAQQLFYGPSSGTTRVSRYQKKHYNLLTPITIIKHPLSASSIHYDPYTILHVQFTHLTTSLQALFGLPLHLKPSTQELRRKHSTGSPNAGQFSKFFHC